MVLRVPRGPLGCRATDSEIVALQSFRDLRVWQLAMDLFVAAHHLSRRLPRDERFELCSQLRRAAGSVAANIAEGTGRTHLGDYLRHLSIARGSVREVESHLEATIRLGYVTVEDVAPVAELADHVSRMLLKLMRRLGARRT
jgi:four helix bundle protein